MEKSNHILSSLFDKNLVDNIADKFDKRRYAYQFYDELDDIIDEGYKNHFKLYKLSQGNHLLLRAHISNTHVDNLIKFIENLTDINIQYQYKPYHDLRYFENNKIYILLGKQQDQCCDYISIRYQTENYVQLLNIVSDKYAWQIFYNKYTRDQFLKIHHTQPKWRTWYKYECDKMNYDLIFDKFNYEKF
jgi:hypothetical protein